MPSADPTVEAPAESSSPELGRLLQLLPISLVSGLTAFWAFSPAVVVRVEGSAVLLQPDSRVGF